MDSSRFDDLARALAAARSRRQLTGGLLGLAIALRAAVPAWGGNKKKKKKKKKQACPPCKKRKKGKCKKKLPDGTACSGGTCQGGLCVGNTPPPNPDPECAGATCDTFEFGCNGNALCACVSTFAGGGFCAMSGGTSCAQLTPCPNGQSDCQPNSTCTVGTCCLEPVCFLDAERCPESAGAVGMAATDSVAVRPLGR